MFVVLLTRATFCIVLYYVCVCSVSWLLLSCQYQCKWSTGKTRLRNDL